MASTWTCKQDAADYVISKARLPGFRKHENRTHRAAQRHSRATLDMQSAEIHRTWPRIRPRHGGSLVMHKAEVMTRPAGDLFRFEARLRQSGFMLSTLNWTAPSSSRMTRSFCGRTSPVLRCCSWMTEPFSIVARQSLKWSNCKSVSATSTA